MVKCVPKLAEYDFSVNAIVAPQYYPEWKVGENFSSVFYQRAVEDSVKIIRCPLYVPKKVTTLKRLVHLSSFAVSSGIALLGQLFKKPDVIFLVQPTMFCAPMTLLVSKLTGAKAIMHIQDFEVDAMFGLGMLGEGKLARVAKKIERWLLNKFDLVSTISYSMMENAKNKGVDESKLLLFPNWADINFVTPEVDGSGLRDEWGFQPEDKVVLYAGNIGKKQGLETVLNAAKHFETNPSVKFVLVGAGAYVNTLKAMCAHLGLQNVQF